MKPFAISNQNSFCTSRRCEGAPGDLSADLPVNSLTQLDGLPIDTSHVEVLQRPIEFTLNSSIRMMHQSREVVFVARVDRHLERVDGEVTAQRGRRLPPDDGPREHVDDERDVGPAGVGLHVGEVCDPQPVRCRRHELAIDEVTRPVLVLVTYGRDLELATAPGAAEPLVFHQPAHRAIGDVDALAMQLLPDLLRAVDAVAVALVHAKDLGLEGLVGDLACTGQPGLGGVVRGRGELQSSADRLDPPSTLAGIDVAHYLLV